MESKKIAVIGCGNLGQSIVNGLLQINTKPEHITATKRNIEPLAALSKLGVQITSDNKKAVANSDLIILAVKPYNVEAILQEINSDLVPSKHVVVSLATAISIQQIEANTPKGIPVFRAMPNTAADVATSLTCICSNTSNKQTTEWVKSCFDGIGETVIINEDLMNAATVIGACGLAFVLRFIRAMIQGGIQIGFDSKTASTIVNQTVKGAAELLIQEKQHPEFEIDKVTTPKGCTIAGLNEMEHNGFSSALIKGIVTSYEAID